MCMLSVITQGAMSIPPNQWTPDTFSQFKEILDVVKQLDEKLGQKNCEDPAKAAWMRGIEARLERLEKI
jgi:hypothetical protein